MSLTAWVFIGKGEKQRLAWFRRSLRGSLFVIVLPDTLGFVFGRIGIKNVSDSSVIDEHDGILNKPASAASVSLCMYI